jgi:hypothetical protein
MFPHDGAVSLSFVRFMLTIGFGGAILVSDDLMLVTSIGLRLE